MFGYKKKYDNALKILDDRDVELNFIVKERDELRKELTNTEKKLEETRQIINQYRTLDDATPSDCKRGSWCKGCEFVKTIFERNGRIYSETYFCGKAESCKNFVQKER